MMCMFVCVCVGAAAAHPRGGHGGAVAARRGRERVPRLPHAPAHQQEEGAPLHTTRTTLCLILFNNCFK